MPSPYKATDTRPNFEMATYLGSLALKHAVDYFRHAGFTVDDLAGDDATREKVLDSLDKNDSILFFGVGHGRADLYTGQNYDYIFWVCDSKELSGRVVYLLSCITGKRLGPDIISKGGWSYIGYKDVFGWVQIELVDPLTEYYAKAFFEPVLEILYTLADGGSTGLAYKKSIDKWNYWIDYWSRQDDPYAALVLKWLIHDRDNQVLYGDENARIAVGINLSYLIPALAPIGLVGGVIISEEGRKYLPGV